MKGMNLAEMKKVAEDKHSATFRHKDGHEIKIAVSALSPKMRKELSGIPIHAAQGTKEPLPHALPPPDQPVGDVGPDVQSSQNDYGADQMRALQNGKVLEQQPPASPSAGASGSWGDSPSGLAPAEPSAQPQQGLAPKQQAKPVQAKASLAPPPAPPENSYQPGQEPQQDQQPKSMEDSPEYQKSFQDYQNEHLQEYAQNAAAFEQDMKSGHITPKTLQSLYADKSTPGKIGTLFGLLIGGAGAGLSHQSNALLEMMQKQIDNDLKAQEASKNNALNFIKIHQAGQLNDAQIDQLKITGKLTLAQAENMKQESRLKARTMATNDAMMGAFQSLADYTKQLPQGQQKSQYEQGLAYMYPMVQQSITDKSTAAAGMGAYMKMMTAPSAVPQGTEKSPVNYQQMNQLERRSQMKVPGAPSAEDIGHMTKEATSLEEGRALRKDFNQAFDALDKMHLAGTFSPNARNAYVNSLAGKLARVSAGRYNEAEAKNQISSMIPEKSDWESTRDIKRKTNNSFFDVNEAGTPTLNRFGLKNSVPESGSSNNPAAAEAWARAHPGEKADKILKVLGKK